MQWIAFMLAFEVGWLPSAELISYAPPSFVDSSNQFYQLAEAKVTLFKFLEIGGSMRVQDWLYRGATDAIGFGFWPNQLDSVLYADILIGPVTVGYRHECAHPVIPYQPLYGFKPAWDGFADTIYARLELKW